ncbi:hypothetical protein HDU67_007721 [Dinochytrium kinnereticum]|nr:hypothetical protein HDU67_007721 [Dinochytrium kinnereticum]
MQMAQRTFSNLPKSRVARTRSLNRDMLDQQDSVADRVRKQMRAQSMSRRIARGNWTMSGSRFVSQVKQPAWAAPLVARPMPPPSKPAPKPKRRTRSLGTANSQLKALLDNLNTLSKRLGTANSPNHVQTLIELSRHWVVQADLREALKVAVLAKTTINKLMVEEEEKLFHKLFSVEGESNGSEVSKAAIPKIETKGSPFDSSILGQVIRQEARVDQIIASLVDARLRETWTDFEVPPLDSEENSPDPSVADTASLYKEEASMTDGSINYATRALDSTSNGSVRAPRSLASMPGTLSSAAPRSAVSRCMSNASIMSPIASSSATVSPKWRSRHASVSNLSLGSSH